MMIHARSARSGDGTTVARRRALSRRALLSLTTVLCSGIASPVIAQVAAPSPSRESVDGNGVDLFHGTLNVDSFKLTMGGGDQAAVYYQYHRTGYNWKSNTAVNLYLNSSAGNAQVSWQGRTFTFSGTSIYTSSDGDGSTLVASGGLYIFTARDGTIVRFDPALGQGGPAFVNGGQAIDVTYANGYKIIFNYEQKKYFKRVIVGGEVDFIEVPVFRLLNIVSSSGYKTQFSYAVASPGQNGAAFGSFYRVTGTTQTNTLSGSSASQSLSITDNLDNFSNGNTTITDPAGRIMTYRMAAGKVAGITRPGSSSEDVTVAYDGSSRVSSVTTAAGAITYGYVDSAGNRTTTVTDPLTHSTVYVFDIASQRIKSVTDATGKTTSWLYDGSGRPTQVTAPEGDYTQYAYDNKGNVTQTTRVAKSGTGLPNIVTKANYPCSSTATCDKPQWTQDAKGNQTDYTYNLSTGTVSTIVAPANANGVRATTNFSYTTVNGIQMPSGTSICVTAASCTNSVNEIRASTGYNANGLPTTVTRQAGDGSLAATTTTAYDDIGNVLTVDGPLAGSADTVRYRYNADRELVGIIGPDPDGGSALKPRAQRLTRDAKGRVTSVELGNVNSQSDADWAGFAALQQATTDYDGADRQVKTTASAGGTAYVVRQYSYDAAGRLDCSAVRMNSATWGSLPGACSPATTGAAGPDRIVRAQYDDAGRQKKVISAYGTAQQSDDVTTTYTSNGQVETVTDAEGNKTSYEYDGFDRLKITRYPVTTVGAGASSTTDYEQLGYDAAGNVTSRRLRDGQTITFGYDNLNRLSSKAPPSPEHAVNYGYDLLNQPISVSRPGDGVAHSLTYNALGQLTGEVQPFGGISYQYDATGRRTRTTWGDGFYVTYDYLVTGEMTAIRENGATSGAGVLATMAYDDLGRRKNIIRGNGTVTDFGYDPASRLASMDTNLAGAAWDARFEFAYNPAGQIAGTTRINDAYAWTGHYNVDRAYAINGLNQVTASGATSLGYDGRGNLTTSGSTVYGYTAENMLKSASNGVSLYYDALGRVSEYDTTVSTRFVSDGDHIAAEVANPSGAIMRRYVFGPGTDAPMVWYEGSGTGDKRWLHADERGSVVAVSDASGNAIGINRYDEYGIPASTNIGRFQYTGQAWLPELGMYYYKARVYSPTLGRFVQADPIGYDGGMNLYNYVGSDPTNSTDPTGLATCSMSVPNSVYGYYYGSWYYLGPSPLPSETHTVSFECNNTGGSGSGGSNYYGGGGSTAPGRNRCFAQYGVPICTAPASQTEQCEAAIDSVASMSAKIGLPFNANTREVLSSLAFGTRSSVRLSSEGMALANSYVQANRGLLTGGASVGGGLRSFQINFGAAAYGGTVNGSGSGPLGALLGRATVLLDGSNQVVGVQDQFDYDPSNHSFPISSGVSRANNILNRGCPNRISSVSVSGGVGR